MNTNTTQQFLETTEPNIIQEWAEVRGGFPVRNINDESQLKIIFDEESEDMADFVKISWEEFFELFEENNFKFYFSPENEESEEGILSNNYRIEEG